MLARSELQARILGAPVDAMRIGIFLASALLTGASVTTAGAIGFVGLVTPHLARLLVGADHRLVLPAAALLGGALVMIADLCARTLFAPRQLPVGALTALIGRRCFSRSCGARRGAEASAFAFERHHVIGLDANPDQLTHCMIVMARDQ